MDTLKKQLAEFAERYAPYIKLVVVNMRLVLLILFSVMSGYLVYRVDGLLNKQVELPTDDSSATTISKQPDKDVISAFNELYVQDIELNSNFDANRDNPF